MQEGRDGHRRTGADARRSGAAQRAGPPPAREGGNVLAPTHRPPTAVPPTRRLPALGSDPGGQRGAAAVGRPRPGEHGYKFVNFLHDYSERPLDLPSLLDMVYLRGTGVPQSADNWATRLGRIARARRAFPVSGTGSRDTVSEARHELYVSARQLHYMHPMRDGTILHGPTLFHHTKLRNNQPSGTSSIPSCT